MKTLEVGALQGFGRILDYGFEILEESYFRRSLTSYM
jgi:hypothetical protein